MDIGSKGKAASCIRCRRISNVGVVIGSRKRLPQYTPFV